MSRAIIRMAGLGAALLAVGGLLALATGETVWGVLVLLAALASGALALKTHRGG